MSDLGYDFLEKGESGNVMQNNPDIPNIFEQRLSDFSGEKGVPVTGPILLQIDQCCLLMERYVSVYGKGKGNRNNLVFRRGIGGGSNRSDVDNCNLLYDILKTLSKAARNQELDHPEPVRKFLAKDIMAYNQSFQDDAFADGRVPGWKTWLNRRRMSGLLKDMDSLSFGRDAVRN